MEGLGPLGETQGGVSSGEPKAFGGEWWIGEEVGRLRLSECRDELGLVARLWECALLQAHDLPSDSLEEIIWG